MIYIGLIFTSLMNKSNLHEKTGLHLLLYQISTFRESSLRHRTDNNRKVYIGKQYGANAIGGIMLFDCPLVYTTPEPSSA